MIQEYFGNATYYTTTLLEYPFKNKCGRVFQIANNFMIHFPNAKINIGLNIVEKRNDGFHSIETIFYPIGLSDVLEFVEGEKVEMKSSGITIDEDWQQNLCVRAYRLLANDFHLPSIIIYLHKIIPIGAGLGGGSSDATYMLKMLNAHFYLKLSVEKLQYYARQLGSDCAFFINNNPVFACGRGDEFSAISLDLKNYFLVLITPEIHINTAEAYSNVSPVKPLFSLRKNIQLPIEQWKNCIHNDFEISVCKKYAEIKTIKEELYSFGATYASMSGSGSSVYGIFKSTPDMQAMQVHFLGNKIWVGKL